MEGGRSTVGKEKPPKCVEGLGINDYPQRQGAGFPIPRHKVPVREVMHRVEGLDGEGSPHVAWNRGAN